MKQSAAQRAAEYLNSWAGGTFSEEAKLAADLLSEDRERRQDKERLDWLDANPQVILRSGKQHIRPLIDAARALPKGKP